MTNDKKIFLRELISVNKLAERAGITASYLSSILNLINYFRRNTSQSKTLIQRINKMIGPDTKEEMLAFVEDVKENWFLNLLIITAISSTIAWCYCVYNAFH